MDRLPVGVLSGWLLCCWVVSCAGGTTPPAAAGSGAGATGERGAQCLTDANAERHPAANAPERIEVRHILVRHRELERPEGATRTREEACLLALDALGELEAGREWSAVTEKYSDAKTDDLGRVAQDELSPSFANAAFELESGELSYVVESDRGFHIILRR